MNAASRLHQPLPCFRQAPFLTMLGLAGMLTMEATAATFTVDTTANEFDTPSGANLSLREALRDAAALAGADNIVFAAALDGQSIVLSGEIAVNDTGGVVVDASSLPNGITIDGGPGTNRIFYVNSSSSGITLTLRGLTLTGGNGTGTTTPADNGVGGAIYYHNHPINGGSLTLERCTISGNTSSTTGGSIFAFATLTMTQCTVSENSSSNGGALDLGDSTVTTLTQCTFTGNTGATIRNRGQLNMRHCTVTGGFNGSETGGIANGETGLPSFGTVTLDRCIIAGNTKAGGTAADLRAYPAKECSQ